MDIKDVKTAELVKKYNFKFSKSLGQNFLIDDSVPRDIVAGAEVDSEDLVIEIGPGVGTLTAQLLKKAKNRYELVIATSKRARQIADGAEVKTDVKEESAVTLAANEIAEGKVKIIEPEEMKEENDEQANEIEE